jgi:hypothetical protein
MVFLDLKQNGKKIGIRALALFIITLLFFLIGTAGGFDRVKPLLENIPEYMKPILGFSSDVDLVDGKSWILAFSMLVELYFLHIAFMDSWGYVSESEDKQRFLFFGNQMYSKVEYVLYGYLFLLVQFFVLWIPYKIMISLICDSMFMLIPTVLNGIGIYLVLIAIGYLVSVLGYSRDVSPEFIYIIVVFLFLLGNVYKFFDAMNARAIELGEFPNEKLIMLSERTKGLHDYSILTYLNPFRMDTMAIGVKGFILGAFLAMIICALTIFVYGNQEH